MIVFLLNAKALWLHWSCMWASIRVLATITLSRQCVFHTAVHPLQRSQLSRISLATHALTHSSLLLTQSGSLAFAVVNIV